STGNQTCNLLITIRLLYLLRHCHSILQYQLSSWTAEKDDINLTSDNLTNLERHLDVDLRLLTSMNLTGQDSVLDCLASYLNCVNYRHACVIGKRSRCHANPLANKLMYTCAYRLELRKWSLEKNFFFTCSYCVREWDKSLYISCIIAAATGDRGGNSLTI